VKPYGKDVPIFYICSIKERKKKKREKMKKDLHVKRMVEVDSVACNKKFQNNFLDLAIKQRTFYNCGGEQSCSYQNACVRRHESITLITSTFCYHNLTANTIKSVPKVHNKDKTPHSFPN
jgi:hypothetical protein